MLQVGRISTPNRVRHRERSIFGSKGVEAFIIRCTQLGTDKAADFDWLLGLRIAHSVGGVHPCAIDVLDAFEPGWNIELLDHELVHAFGAEAAQLTDAFAFWWNRTTRPMGRMRIDEIRAFLLADQPGKPEWARVGRRQARYSTRPATMAVIVKRLMDKSSQSRFELARD
jgi:hypothetical protein